MCHHVQTTHFLIKIPIHVLINVLLTIQQEFIGMEIKLNLFQNVLKLQIVQIHILLMIICKFVFRRAPKISLNLIKIV